LRLRLGFALVIAIGLLTGLLALQTTSRISAIVTDLHEHPFTVTNAVLSLRAEIYAMRAGMISALRAQSPDELAEFTAEVARAEAKASSQFQLISLQYLGPTGDVQALYQSMELWKSGREYRLNLARQGRFAEAMADANRAGRMQFEQLRGDLDRIYVFAASKAQFFKEQSEKERDRATVTLVALLAAMVVLGLLAAQIIIGSIVSPLGRLRAAMTRLATGDLSAEIPGTGGTDEVAEMARAASVFKDAAVDLEHRRWIKESVARLLGRLQEAGTLAALALAALRTLGPLLGVPRLVFHQVMADGSAPRPLADWGAGAHEMPGPGRMITLAWHGETYGMLEVIGAETLSVEASILLDEAVPLLALHLAILKQHLKTIELLHKTRDQARDLELSRADLERFAQVLAHHIQEPVRLQHTYADLLARSLGDDASDETRAALGFITEGALRLRSLIHDVQLYLGLDRTAAVSEPCDTDAAFNAAWQSLGAMLDGAGAVLARSPLPTTWVTRAALIDIFTQLLDNAIKYRRPDQPLRLELTATTQGDFVLIRLADNGIGIEPQYRERVFKVFERLQGGRDRSGTGIGLAMVRKVVESAGGKAWIEDGQGGGICVCLSLRTSRP
jgi:signal transduction histidine kinase/HAMP domain-containing protein